jgi:esterase
MTPHWPIPKDAKWLEVNGYPMTYQDVGSGPTIFLIHGSIVDYRIWAPTVSGLSPRFRIVAPSLRHYYPEPWDGIGPHFTVEQQAADTAALVRSLKLGQVHLLGWSRGAAVAVEMARQAPELVKTLILEDGSVSLAGEETETMRRARTASQERLGALRSAVQSGEFERGARQLVDTLNGPDAWSRLSADLRQIMLDNIRTALAAVNVPVRSEVLAALRMPMLLLTGENSPKSYAEFYDTLRKLRECGPTTVIPNAAHMMHLDNPVAFNEAVAAFVSSH